MWVPGEEAGGVIGGKFEWLFFKPWPCLTQKPLTFILLPCLRQEPIFQGLRYRRPHMKTAHRQSSTSGQNFKWWNCIPFLRQSFKMPKTTSLFQVARWSGPRNWERTKREETGTRNGDFLPSFLIPATAPFPKITRSYFGAPFIYASSLLSGLSGSLEKTGKILTVQQQIPV